MSTPLEKFQSLLRELFQFEQADLDFGVYRIMNMRRERMEKWLNEELPERAREILKQGGATADDDLSARIEALKGQLLEMDPGGIDEDGNIVNESLKGIAKGKEYIKLKTQLDRAPARTTAGMESAVYNHLYDFFSRYYEAGDFIPKRRRSFAPDGRDTYAIPWDGEEVVLHWANKDQYYIKTGERFTHYRWQSEAGGRAFTVEFRLTDADLPANNNKDAQKKFNLLVPDKVEWQEDTSTLFIPFHYRGLTPEEEGQYTGTQEGKLRASIIKRTVERIRELPVVASVPQLATALMAPKKDAAGQEKRDKDGNAVPLLPHHLNRWAVKNESDFFIHKNLRRFLTGELDYFLKSVVLNIDNLLAAGEQRAEPNFRLLAAVKRLGTEIVDFVSQLEDFQKGLFEKKKFVLETSWCLTLDRIPAAVKEEVYAAILANDRQWEEWEWLYKISHWPADIATAAPRTRDFLESYPYLMFDTGLKTDSGTPAFASELVNKLIESVPDLDQEANGIIVQSENLQALRLLKARFGGCARCAYADPPYNTSDIGFNYKNQFKHSSWASMTHQTLSALKDLIEPSGVAAIAIDDAEHEVLRGVGDSVFGQNTHLGTLVVENKPSGRTNDDFLATSHEYYELFARESEMAAIVFFPLTEEQRAAYSESDSNGAFKWRDFMRTGGLSTPRERPNSYYPIFFEQATGRISIEPLPGAIKILPVDSNGMHRVWRKTRPSFMRHVLANEIKVEQARGGEWKVRIIDREKSGVRPKSVWVGNLYDSSAHGSKLLSKLFGERDFAFPKSLHATRDVIFICAGDDESALTIDPFGGSGTTAHAVIEINRQEDYSQRYLLMEMGSHFDAVLKPRIQKVAFSEDWKNGAPVRQISPRTPANPYNGISHCIKVVRLESYEDALDNIGFNIGHAPGAELGLDFLRDYELRYALDWESKESPTRLAVDQLDTPFDYTLTLRRESGTVNVKPDLPETFAYLIGLHTRRRFRAERDGVSYLIYTGTLHADGTEVAVLWRTCRGWTEAKLKTEKDWWREQREMLAPGATRIYVNGASAIEGHYSLDAEFKSRMHGTAA